LPNHSFFLFGPRGTGKTTWLRKKLPEALWVNLLLDDHYFPLLRSSRWLREQVEALPRGCVVYRGESRCRSGKVTGLPVEDFLKRLYDGFFEAPEL
jgi:hypothetical protein